MIIQGLLCPIFGATLFETAPIPTTMFPGIAIGNSSTIEQAVGYKFHLDQQTQITRGGGVFYSTAGAGLFAQIMDLAPGTGTPAASPYVDTGYGRSSFSIGSGLTDYSLDYMLLLPAGDYALIFGMAPLFGGDAAMPEGDTSVSSEYAVWLKMTLPPFPSCHRPYLRVAGSRPQASTGLSSKAMQLRPRLRLRNPQRLV